MHREGNTYNRFIFNGATNHEVPDMHDSVFLNTSKIVNRCSLFGVQKKPFSHVDHIHRQHNIPVHLQLLLLSHRILCWDEENRLTAVKDENHLSAYIYDAGGERVWKLTGQVQQMQIGGGGVVDAVDLNNRTLYVSPYLVYNETGYSKHYYAGAERVSSRIGGGMNQALLHPLLDTLTPLSKPADYNVIQEELQIMLSRQVACTGMDPSYVLMESAFHSVAQSTQMADPEDNWYIYHSDHLGSSAFLTDASGTPTQHLQYLPFGESFIEQRSVTEYYTSYTFSAKERDLETGYSYFGARYYDAGLSVWLSVDPMAFLYPDQSPYSYVGNRPIMVTDPNGMWEQDGDGNWIAQKGDNAWSLAKHAGISFDEAKQLMKDQGFKFSNNDEHVHVEIGDVVKIPTKTNNNNKSSTQGMPPINDHLTGDIITHDGKDYMLYDQRWLELLPESHYYIQYTDPLDISIEGGTYRVSRQQIAINDYHHKVGVNGGIPLGSAGGVIGLIIDRVIDGKITPLALTAGFLKGYFNAIRQVDQRNREHDRNVRKQRNYHAQ
jgi:RHS repeat-associated protein